MQRMLNKDLALFMQSLSQVGCISHETRPKLELTETGKGKKKTFNVDPKILRLLCHFKPKISKLFALCAWPNFGG